MLSLTTLCLFLAASIQAFPLVKRDVVNPRITSPDASTVWVVGQVQTVTWDTSSLPPDSQITNPNGTVVLGFLEDGDPSEHLMLDNPLAKSFPLRDGQVNVTVPTVNPRKDYIIVLMGDSGNISPKFTINADQTLAASASSSDSLITTPIPITGSIITGSSSSVFSSSVTSASTDASVTATPSPPISVPDSSDSVPQSTATAPSASPSSTAASSVSASSDSSSNSSSSTASAAAVSQTGSNGAWKWGYSHACSFTIAAIIVFLQA